MNAAQYLADREEWDPSAEMLRAKTREGAAETVLFEVMLADWVDNHGRDQDGKSHFECREEMLDALFA